MTRYEANNEILDLLQNYCQAYPDQRFGQVLTNLDIATHLNFGEGKMKDIFFEESEYLLTRIKNQYAYLVEEVIVEDEKQNAGNESIN